MCLFDFKDPQNIGKEYDGFVLLAVNQIENDGGTGVYLRHKITGLEVYHVITDDDENLFSFAFRTLAKNSMGAAHIMEHSVLCGSEKFPLKEPFSTLESQSVKTFLNAFTYPDKTAYPAASLVKSDYFNLFDVYADAVFFPLLSKETFMQEGHRVELDENGKASIQGVVYNEMKGAYSSFSSVAIHKIIDTMYPDSFAGYESGGDPLEITNLTYEAFLDFHQKFYSPDNCLLFLYGNIPTAEQLDFLNQKFIPRIEKKYGCKEIIPNFDSKLPLVKPEIKELQKMPHLKESVSVKYEAPETGANGSMVTMNWYTGDYDIEKNYLSEVLFGSDSSLLVRKLKDSKLGFDIAPSCGSFAQHHDTFFNIGLTGVKKGNEEKVRQLIEKTIREVYEEGFKDEDIESTVMGADFSLREVTRNSGPFSIILMSSVISCWSNGQNPAARMNPVTRFEEIKKNIKADKDYTRNLIKKYLIDTDISAFIVIEPSKSYFADRNKKEAELISKLNKTIDKEKLKKELDLLHAYQQKKETPEELSCIPHLKPSELEIMPKPINTVVKAVCNSEGKEVPVLLNTEPTKGIAYVDVLFPLDYLKPEDYLDLPLFYGILTNLGWSGKNWSDCITESGCIMGDIWANTLLKTTVESEQTLKNTEPYKKWNICGRNWLLISCKFLAEKTEESMEMLSKVITQMDFDDVDHFKTLIDEYITDKQLSFLSDSLSYIGRRIRADFTETYAIGELAKGFTHLEHCRQYKKSKAAAILKRFKSLYKTVTSQGGLIHITADEKTLKGVEQTLGTFVNSAKLTTPSEIKPVNLDDLTKLFYDFKKADNCKESIKVPSQTGYSGMAIPSSYRGTKESCAEQIFATWLSNHTLWDKIRTTGGAYGAFCGTDPTMKAFSFISYRDPVPEKTVELFFEVLNEDYSNLITEEDVECAIISNLSDEIVPDSPSRRGTRGMRRVLYGISNDNIQQDLNQLLDVKVSDVVEAAKRLNENAKSKRRQVIICDKSKSNYGKQIKIRI